VGLFKGINGVFVNVIDGLIVNKKLLTMSQNNELILHFHTFVCAPTFILVTNIIMCQLCILLTLGLIDFQASFSLPRLHNTNLEICAS